MIRSISIINQVTFDSGYNIHKLINATKKH